MDKGSTGSKQTKRYSWIIGLLIFITALLLGCIIVKNIEKEKKTAAAYTAQSTVKRINAQLDQYVELSEFLGNVVLTGYKLDQTSFSELAKMLPNEDGIVKAFELAPDGVVTDIFPQQGNENAFGINMLTDHERKEDANRAKETGNYTLGGPYRLKQGGTGALLFHPVYKEDSIDYKRWIISNCSIFPLGIAILFVGLSSVIIRIFHIDFEFTDTLLLIAFGIVSHLLYRFGTLVLRLEGKNKLYSAVYVANKCIYILLALGLVLFTDWNRFHCLAFATVVAFASAALFSVYVSRDKWKISLKGQYSQFTRKELIIYGLPFIISMGITTLFQSIDKLSLNRFCDYATVGVYTSAMTIVSVFSIIQTAFNTMWAPMMVKHYEQAPEDRAFYSKYNASITVIMFAFGLTLILFKDIFGLLLGEKYRAASYIVPFLTLEPIMFTISETTVTGIVVKNKSQMHIVVGVVACLTNLIGNTILIPLIGPKGAAISTGLSYVVYLALRTIIGNHYYKVSYPIAKFVFITIVLVGFAALNSYFPFGIWTVGCYFASAFILFFLYKDTIRNLYEKLSATVRKEVTRIRS